MILPRSHLALLSFALHAAAQTSAPPASAAPRPTLNHALVFLDAAHGGDDSGARLSDQLLEKDITLALANRIRSQLAAFGLNVLMTRDAESQDKPATTTVPAPVPAPSLDVRAGLANHVHPFACLVLHATGVGAGVHLVTSALPAPTGNGEAASSSLVPWESAQSSFIPQSTHLATELSTALARTEMPVHASRASIRPLNNLTCPAVLIELAPLAGTSVGDAGYQARVAQAVATALLFWRAHAEPEVTDPASGGHVAPGPDTTAGSGAAQP